MAKQNTNKTNKVAAKQAPVKKSAPNKSAKASEAKDCGCSTDESCETPSKTSSSSLPRRRL